MVIRTIFANEANKEQYKDLVLGWLESDFYQRGEPECHFWRNRRVIAASFASCDAMVAVNAKDEFVGYMIWTPNKYSTEIDIVEVEKKYRRQGVFKKMLSDFSAAYPDVCVFTASVIEQSQAKFRQAGWQVIQDPNREEKFYKPVIPCLSPTFELPRVGHAIGVFSKLDIDPSSREYIDAYMVRDNPSKYKIKYFSIDVDANGKLSAPIVTNFHYEGYVGVYLDGKLIVSGKARILESAARCFNLLAISKIEPAPEYMHVFQETGFFLQQPQSQPEIKTAETEFDKPPRKRPRLDQQEATSLGTTCAASPNSVAGEMAKRWIFKDVAPAPTAASHKEEAVAKKSTP